MTVAEEEEKEVRVLVVDVRSLVSITEVDTVFSHVGEQENDESTTAIPSETLLEYGDALFINGI